MFVLYRLKNTANEKTALLAYHGYVSSLLRYGIILWGNSTDIDKVFLVQKKCVRAISGVGPRDSCKPLFKKYKLLTVTSLYILEIGNFIRKNMKFFNRYNQIQRLRPRDPYKLEVPVCKSALRNNNCYVMPVRIYNNIPFEIRQLPTPLFLRKLEKWLVKECFYNLREYFEMQ